MNKGQILEAVRRALERTLEERGCSVPVLAKALNVKQNRLYRILNDETQDVSLDLAIALFKLRNDSMDQVFDIRSPGALDVTIDQAADLLLKKVLEKFSGVLRLDDTGGTMSQHPVPADEIIGTHRATQAPIGATDFDALNDAATDLDRVAKSDAEEREKEA